MSNVWNILNKEKYTIDGAIHAEEIYGFLSNLKNTTGESALKQLFDYWDNDQHDTFKILRGILYPETCKTSTFSSNP